MKKLLSLATFIMLLSVQIFSSPRDFVAIVEPEVPDQFKKTYEEIAKMFDASNEKEASDYIRAIAKGGYGSGFIVELPNKEKILVTNGHVTDGAYEALVKIDSGLKNGVTSEKVQVLYVDPIYDLAFLAVPKGFKIPALKIANSLPNDGAEVWSAGYPGLFNKPAWQFAKGNITNRNIMVEIEDGEEEGFIQHSASIDPGNSGGPLIVGNPSNEASFTILGINTWKVSNRTSTGFAIPYTSLNEALARYQAFAAKKETNETALRAQVDQLLVLLNKKAFKVTGPKFLLGDEYVSVETYKSFDWASKTMSEADLKEWALYFFSRPAQALKFFTLKSFFEKTHKFTDELTLGEISADGEKYKVSFKLGSKTIKTTWALRLNFWQMTESDFDDLTPDEDKENKNSASAPKTEKDSLEVDHVVGIKIRLDMAFVSGAPTSVSPVNVDADLGIVVPAFGNIVIEPGLTFTTVTGSVERYGLETTWKSAQMFGPYFNAMFELPIDLKEVGIVPFAGIGIKYLFGKGDDKASSFSSLGTVILVRAMGGVELVLSRGFAIGIDGGYSLYAMSMGYTFEPVGTPLVGIYGKLRL